MQIENFAIANAPQIRTHILRWVWGLLIATWIGSVGAAALQDPVTQPVDSGTQTASDGSVRRGAAPSGPVTDGHEEKSGDFWLTAFTGLLVVVGIIQAGVLIGHARLFASAEDTKHKELRAYITAGVGQAIPQMTIPNGRLRFEAKPSIINMGRSPAYKVSWIARAEILPVPLAVGYRFPELPEPATEGIVLGPNQSMFISAVVPGEFIPKDQVDDIRFGRGRALYVWAAVTYFDVFGRKRATKLAQMITFSDDNKSINAIYPNQHNFAD